MEEMLRFSIPVEYGINMCTEKKRVPLYAGKKKKLTDTFLDELIEAKENKCNNPSFTLYDKNTDDGKPVIISFSDDKMLVNFKQESMRMDINFDTFFKTYIKHVRDCALYYVAPSSYVKILFTSPLDVFLKKINKYRPQEAELLKRIEKY